MYVMTPEFGAASQLEKIDMLDFADIVVINKFDRKGSDDALRDVSKQLQRNREAFDRMPSDMPVFGSIASHFNDDGVTAAYQYLLGVLREKGLKDYDSKLPVVTTKVSTEKAPSYRLIARAIWRRLRTRSAIITNMPRSKAVLPLNMNI